MALISCPECGKEISDSALTCPHCGKRLSSFHGIRERGRHWLRLEDREGRWLNRPIGCVTTLVIYLVIVAIAVVGITTNQIVYNTPATSSVVSGEHAEFEVVQNSVKFERRTNNSTVYVTGKVTNYRERACYIEVFYTINDTDGNVIVKNSVLSETSIRPGKNFSFLVEFYDEAARATSFKITDIVGH